MNNTINTNKSDYRITDPSNSLHTSQHSSSVPKNDSTKNNDRLIKNMDIQNNNNIINNNNSNNTNTINTNNKLQSHSSPTARDVNGPVRSGFGSVLIGPRSYDGLRT